MKNILLTLITSTLIIPFACNPKEEIAPENPCGKYLQPNADFIIEETTYEFDPYPYYKWYANPFQTKDTIKLLGSYQFRSEFIDTNIYKHTWYIGSEVLHNYKEWRDFRDVHTPLYIKISHVMKWKSNKFCNPNETGYDSASFTFKITDRLKELGTFGKYRMVYDTLGAPIIQDSVDIELYRCRTNFKDSIIQEPIYSDDLSQFRIKGLFTVWEEDKKWVVIPSNEEALDNQNRFVSNSYTRFMGGGLVRNLKIDINKNNKAFMEYNNWTPINKLYKIKKYALNGRKLN
jgi:hypothetical protein